MAIAPFVFLRRRRAKKRRREKKKKNKNNKQGGGPGHLYASGNGRRMAMVEHISFRREGQRPIHYHFRGRGGHGHRPPLLKKRKKKEHRGKSHSSSLLKITRMLPMAKHISLTKRKSEVLALTTITLLSLRRKSKEQAEAGGRQGGWSKKKQ